MFVYRIEVREPSNQGYETSCYTHSFPSHEAADTWAEEYPYHLTMTFLFEVERSDQGHLVEV